MAAEAEEEAQELPQPHQPQQQFHAIMSARLCAWMTITSHSATKEYLMELTAALAALFAANPFVLPALKQVQEQLYRKTRLARMNAALICLAMNTSIALLGLLAAIIYAKKNAKKALGFIYQNYYFG